ncbi:MAG: putative Mn2+ efflux pump MntP [Brevundimonas sp.]|jgi:putative Mn2+ efflux pump MntP
MLVLPFAVVFGLSLDVWSLATIRSAASGASRLVMARAALRLSLIVGAALGLGLGLGGLIRPLDHALSLMVARGLLLVTGAGLLREGLDTGAANDLRRLPGSLTFWTRTARGYGLPAFISGLSAALAGIGDPGLALAGLIATFAAAFSGLILGRPQDRWIEAAPLLIGGLVLMAVSLAPL